ncbi:hypothetical protein OCK74_24170 [Chitinophagaceae bacterium LB-8]|uniref:Uncharacterized protein n=1 Tax=Paraflavisolibacter caeni TaxID=2982496 RepID=A0A9X2Y0D8_9BACT|nr:hypothetical protein [Paraflavisolibacter caeni]MCU7552237.1 hypothetical protein [Paraflavisolibacter caeni]
MTQDKLMMMDTGLIETYYAKENGYHPFFIREHWQVAQLNYLPWLSFTTIERLEQHQQTDEIFVLTKGRAVLIAASMENSMVNFECILMKPGVTYNIPVNAWHSIAMDEDAEIIIVEKSNTHLGDVIYYPLSEMDKNKLKNQILELVQTSNY